MRSRASKKLFLPAVKAFMTNYSCRDMMTVEIMSFQTMGSVPLTNESEPLRSGDLFCDVTSRAGVIATHCRRHVACFGHVDSMDTHA